MVDVWTPNEHERAALDLGAHPATMMVTLGAAGVEVVMPDHTARVAAFPVDPVDTTGAGDAFNGAVAARLAAGAGPVDAAVFGAAAGALATTTAGAVPAMPVREAIERLITSHAS